MSLPLFDHSECPAPCSPPSPAGLAAGYRTPLPSGGFDLKATLESGQVFHWLSNDDGSWQGLIGQIPVRLWSDGTHLHSTVPPDTITNYFRLDDPLPEIIAAFPRTPYAQDAAKSCPGLRLIRQPFWECLATFLCSSMKQVAHIRQITNTLRERYGQSIDLPWATPSAPSCLHAFPSPEVVAALSEKELRACGLGYRAKSLQATADLLTTHSMQEEELRALPTNKARERLQTLPGVGPKIANCVLLFSLDRLEAVPVDVWIARVLQGLARRKLTVREMESRIRRLGPYAGYVQQYYFHHARAHRSLPPSAPTSAPRSARSSRHLFIALFSSISVFEQFSSLASFL